MRNYFWLDVWQQLTRQVCECKHTKRHHIKLSKEFTKRSDVQCLDWVFKGGAFGEHGTLGCCQCLSYNQKESIFQILTTRIKFMIKPPNKFPTPKECFCICNHSAFDHNIGNSFSLEPLYPPCTKCNCKEYDYTNNPKIGEPHIEGSVKPD